VGLGECIRTVLPQYMYLYIEGDSDTEVDIGTDTYVKNIVNSSYLRFAWI
jgi:hypothetical protein